MSTQAVPELYWHGEQLQNCSHSAKAALPAIPPPPNFVRRAASDKIYRFLGTIR